jgi:hypothetical protein
MQHLEEGWVWWGGRGGGGGGGRKGVQVGRRGAVTAVDLKSSAVNSKEDARCCTTALLPSKQPHVL